MDQQLITEIKLKLINFIDPYHLCLPQDRELINGIIEALNRYGIKNLPQDTYLSEISLKDLPKLVEKVLYEINTQFSNNENIIDFRPIYKSEWKCIEPTFHDTIDGYISVKLTNIVTELIAKFDNETTKFYLNKILDENDKINFNKYLNYFISNKDNNNHERIYIELNELFDIYQEEFQIINKRAFIISLGLPLDCREDIIYSIKQLLNLYITKSYHYLHFNKEKYNDLFINLSNFAKNSISLRNHLMINVPSDFDIKQKEEEIISLATQASTNIITTNDFQKMLLLVAHPKITIDLRKTNTDRKNLLLIAQDINHLAAQDFIDAIITKILSQKNTDEAVHLFNKYFCLQWSFKAKNLHNFKKIFVTCKDIDLNGAEGKALFNTLETYSREEKYQFLHVIISEIAHSSGEYYLSLESLLMEACKNNFDDLVRILLKKGAKVNFSIKDGVLPLHIAAALGDIKLTKILLEHGAIVDAKDGLGHTPLYLASSNGHSEVSDYLLNLRF